MYCPKCGEILTRRNGELTCLAGDMGLSRNVEQRLMERYAPEAPPQSPLPLYVPQLHRSRWRWWCPGCGVRLNERQECPQCGKHLRDLFYPLVELHPHREPLSSPSSSDTP